MNGWKRLAVASVVATIGMMASSGWPTLGGYLGTHATAAPIGALDMYKEKSTPAVRVSNDEPIAELRIDHTTFRIPKRYVRYYDEQNHNAIAFSFASRCDPDRAIFGWCREWE
jgi:hypothetical protein